MIGGTYNNAEILLTGRKVDKERCIRMWMRLKK